MDKEKIALKTISLKDLWNVLRGCFYYVIIAVVVVSVAFYFYAKANYVPMYSSTATLYLLGTRENTEIDPEGNSDQQWTVNDALANVVRADSAYLLTSRTVLNKLGDELGVKNGYGAFKSGISISNPEDTRVLEVTATATSPEMAKQIVDGVCRIGAESINEILDYDQLRVYEEGTYSPYAINGVSFTSYLIYGIAAGGVIYIIFLALFLFDNYIHTDDDIERCLGLSILGDIPDAEEAKKKGKYAYGKNKFSEIDGGKK